MSLKYREIEPAMALTEPLYVSEGVEGVAPPVPRFSWPVVGVVAVVGVALLVVAAAGVAESSLLLTCRLLAQARMTASLRNSDSGG